MIIRYLIALPIVFAAVLIAAFTDDSLEVHSSATLSRIKAQYLDDIARLGEALNALGESLEENEGESIVRARFADARALYKKIEFLVEYFDSQSAWKFNGVPLPKINSSDKLRSIIPPEGFQVIEEMIYGEDVSSMRVELRQAVEAMRSTQRRMGQFAESIELSDRHVFEAAREQIVRVMTLGITGFDTPGSGDAISETERSLVGVYEMMQQYYRALDVRSPEIRIDLDRAFNQGLIYLRENRDFDSFDRLYFIREFGNRLYALLLRTHRALGIETNSEAVPFNRSVNYEAENIFDRDFLNPYFYSADARESSHSMRAELGRLLFFDPVLSGDNSRACASCHNPDLAFTDGLPKSPGFGGGAVARNAPTLLNSAFQNSLFYDSRVTYFEEQVEQVLLNVREMHMSFEELIPKLATSPDYLDLFAAAFRGTADSSISYVNIRAALGSYMRTLVALDSPFDRYMRAETSEIGDGVRHGFNLFMGKAKCGTCHFAPIFNGTVPPGFIETEVEILGVPENPEHDAGQIDADQGRYSIFLDEIHRHAFKTTTVRNVELTAPYMHNGVYRTLEEVIDFYDRGGGAGVGINLPNQTLPPDPLELTAEEKKDLVSFMKALTDTSGTTSRPKRLPTFPARPPLNKRVIGGRY